MHPPRVERAVQGGRRQDRLEEDGCEDGCREALQDLDDQGGESGDAVGGGGRDRAVAGVKHVGQEAGDGEEDGEDGDCGGDGEGYG